MDIIGDMSPSELIMIGKSTSAKLDKLGIHTIRALAAADRDMLRDHFGIIADRMSDAARGVEKEEVRLYNDRRAPKSVSHGTTTPRDMTTEEDVRIVVYALAELVAMRLRRYGFSAEGVGITVREAATLSHKSAQCTLPSPTSNAATIAENALALLPKLHTFPVPLRAVSVAATKLSDGSVTQLSLFDSERDEREEKLEKALTTSAESTVIKLSNAGLCSKTILQTISTRTTISCPSRDEVTMKIAIATNNKKKLKEIRAVLGGFFEEMYSLADLGIDIDIEETGTTLTENALIKARTILRLTGLASLADDSGLMCDALGGAPGVYSARYAGEQHDDAANNALLLKTLPARTDRHTSVPSSRCVCPTAESSPRKDGWTAASWTRNAERAASATILSSSLPNSARPSRRRHPRKRTPSPTAAERCARWKPSSNARGCKTPEREFIGTFRHINNILCP